MMVEAWFFLLIMNGSGKTALNVGPFYTQIACEEVRRQAVASESGSWTISAVGCWRGPVVVSK